MPKVFHVATDRLSVPDPELAQLVERVGPADHGRGARIARSLAIMFRDDHVIQPVSTILAGASDAELVHAGDVLEAAVAQAQAEGHPAASRLGELAAQFGAFASGVAA